MMGILICLALNKVTVIENGSISRFKLTDEIKEWFFSLFYSGNYIIKSEGTCFYIGETI
jgi:hypothetical protein